MKLLNLNIETNVKSLIKMMIIRNLPQPSSLLSLSSLSVVLIVKKMMHCSCLCWHRSSSSSSSLKSFNKRSFNKSSLNPLSSSLLLLLPLLLLIIISLINIVKCYPASSSFISLYTSNDSNVNILYSSNITEFIVDQHKNGQKIQLIQFYSSYCGHCQNFAPLYKQFLRSTVKQWSSVVDFAVLDCANELNSKACRQYKIEFYPTLRTWWLRPSIDDIGNDFQLNHWLSARQLRYSFIEWLTKQYEKHQSEIPKHWPNLLPLNVANNDELYKKLEQLNNGHNGNDDDDRKILIIVEDKDSYFGRELMMNLSSYTNVLRIYRMEKSKDNDHHLLKLSNDGGGIDDNVEHMKQLSLPFLYVIDKNKPDTAENRYNVKVIPKPKIINDHNDDSNNEYWTNLITKEFLKDHDQSQVQAPDLVDNIKHNKNDDKSMKKSPVNYSTRIYMSDLNNAIRFALFHEITLKSKLNSTQTNSLISFLLVLYENFPFQNDKTKQFVKHFHDWLVKHLNRRIMHKRIKNGQDNDDDSIIDTNDMLTTINMYEEYYHFPEYKPWKSCAVITKEYQRSYPCSLWTLFHVLTVAEYRHTMKTKQWLSLHSTLYAMREYVRHFFSCTECSKHFTQMSSKLENELVYPNSSVLWLWHAHNRVNARLKDSKSEDKNLPKRQFPTFEECPECYSKPPPIDNPDLMNKLWKNATTFLQEYYNQELILKFLVNYYSAENIIMDDTETDDNNQTPQSKIINIDHPPLMEHNDDAAVAVTNDATKPRSKILMIVSSPFTQTDISLIFLFYLISIILLLSLFGYVRSSSRRNNLLFKIFNLNSSNKQRMY